MGHRNLLNLGKALVGGPLDGEKVGDRPFEETLDGRAVKVVEMAEPSWHALASGAVPVEAPLRHHVYKRHGDKLAYAPPAP